MAVINLGATDNISAAAKAATDSLAKLADASDKASTAATKVGETTKQAGTSATSAINKWDDVTKSLNRYNSLLGTIQRAQDAFAQANAAGAGDLDAQQRALDGMSAALEKVEAKLVKLGVTVKDTASAEEKLAAIMTEVAAKAELAAQAQAAYNAALGVQSQTEDRYAQRAADVEAYARALDSLRSEFSPIFAVSKQYEDQLDRIAYAQRVGAISADEAARAMERATSKFQAAASPLIDLTTAQTKLAEIQTEATARTQAQTAAMQAAAEAQAAYNQRLGVQSTSSDDYAKRAADVEAYGNAIDALRAKYVPLFGAQQQYKQSVAEITEAQKTGALSSQEANAAIEAARQKLTAASQPTRQATKDATDLAGAHTNAAFAARMMGVQFFQAGSQIAAGQPVMMTAIQQGHQIVDVFLASGMSAGQFGKALLGMINPITLSIAAVVAAGTAIYELGSKSEAQQEALIGLSNQLRATRADYQAMAQEAMAAAKAVSGGGSGISEPDALSAAKTIASSSFFAGSQKDLQGLIQTAQNLALVMGVTLPQAAGELANALTNPGAEADKLATNHFPGMSRALADNIKLMQTGGDQAGAYNAVLGVLRKQTAGANQNLTPLQEALRKLSEAFHGAGSDGQSLADVLGKAIADAATIAVQGLTNVTNAIKEMRNIAVGQKDGSIPGASAGSTNPVYVQPNPNVTPYASNLIYSIAQQKNYAGDPRVSALEADLATQFAVRESFGGKQFDNNGNLIKSARGGIGILGVTMPTAQDMGYNPNTPEGRAFDPATPEGNVNSGLKRIDVLFRKYNGNPGLVTMAWNWGPTALDQVLQGIESPDSVPKETADYVKAITGQDYTSFLPGGTNYTTSTKPVTPKGELGSGPFGVISGVNSDGTVAGTPEAVVAKLRQQQIDNGAGIADGLGTTAGTAAEAAAKIRGLKGEIDALIATNQQGTLEWNKATEALTAAEKELYNAVTPTEQLHRADAIQLMDLQAMTEAYAKSDQAIENATAKQQARAALQQAGWTPAQRGYNQALADETANQKALIDQQGRLDYAKQLKDSKDQLDAQLKITAAYDGTAQSLTHAQDVEKARAQLVQDKIMPTDADYTEKLNRLAAGYDAAAVAAQTLQQQQASVQALSSAFSDAFTTIGNAITQAFIQGQGAAVNWGNVMKGVLTQVIEKIAQLAILNPILNSLFGQNNGTLGSALAVLGNSGTTTSSSGVGSSSGGGGVLGSIGSISNIASTGKNLYGVFQNGIQSSFVNGIGSSTGLFNSFVPAAYEALPNGVSGPVAGAADTGLIPATASDFIGGVGVGYGAGSLVGGLVTNSLGKTGPGANIGAAVGATAGAIIGSFVPVIGTFLGGVIGGVIGGAGGGLIGPKKPSAYNTTGLGVDWQNGILSIGDSHQQLDQSNRQPTAQDIQTVNSFLEANNLRVVDQGLVRQIGIGGQLNSANPGGFADIGKFTSLDAAFSQFRFGSNSDSIENQFLPSMHFPSFADFTAWVTKFTQVQQQAIGIIQNDTTIMNGLGKTTGSYVTQMKQLDDTYNAAISTIDGLKASGMVTADQIDKLTQAETDLATVRGKAAQEYSDQANAAVKQTTDSYLYAFQNADADLSGDPRKAQAYALYQFDENAKVQEDAFKKQLVDIFGDAFTATQTYADEVAFVEKSTATQRLDIIKKFSDQAKASATQMLSSISQFAKSLTTGDLSPLNPREKLQTSAEAYAHDRDLAKLGDAKAIAAITTDSQAYLAQAHAYYGSGAGYVEAFNDVLDALQSITNLGPDTLTQSAMNAAIDSQTTTLNDTLTTISNTLVSIRTQLKQNSNAPATVGA